MTEGTPSSWQERLDNPWVRGFLIFAAFRAVYGIGILIVTYILFTNDAAPLWAPLLFLVASMIISRVLFSWLKRRWPSLFQSKADFKENLAEH
ncbi:MAG: hypothetical protein L7S56_06300 [Candidatus Poseidonia sp.]|nr:hypothetical protein [Poseidonia sp.]